MNLYDHKYMRFMDNKVVGKEPGTDYDNAFMKSYDEAVHWLNT
jgi:hypothetical protein